jgi:protein-S-isoprenylcysteine O-methyltransferase Ste14
MIEQILVLVLPLLFLGLFIARNLIVKARAGESIRSRDRLVTASIILSALCILVTILSVYSEPFYQFAAALSFIRFPFISYLGLALFAVAIILGAVFSAQLKDSWRIGVHEDQKTTLIKTGVYAHIRNPYFFSYFIMFFSMLCIRPSLLLLVLILAAVSVFHKMVRKEERYLAGVHGGEYEGYKNQTGRYLPRFRNGH